MEVVPTGTRSLHLTVIELEEVLHLSFNTLDETCRRSRPAHDVFPLTFIGPPMASTLEEEIQSRRFVGLAAEMRFRPDAVERRPKTRTTPPRPLQSFTTLSVDTTNREKRHLPRTGDSADCSSAYVLIFSKNVQEVRARSRHETTSLLGPAEESTTGPIEGAPLNKEGGTPRMQ